MSSRLLLLSALLTLDVFAAPPALEVSDVKVVSHTPEYYLGWPTVIGRKDGELVLTYSGGRDYHVCPFGRVETMVSKDGGQSWSWPRIVLDSATDDRDAGLLETAKGTLLLSTFTSLAYQEHLGNPERLLKKQFGDKLDEHLARWKSAEVATTDEQRKSDVGMWFLRSTDGGKTWSERLPAPCNSPHGPTQLHDGRLLYVGKELWTEEKKAGVWESRDDGLTWNHVTYLPVRPDENTLDYHELHAVEADDGTIIAHIRNHKGKIRETLQTESKDGGKTWSMPHEIGVSGFPSHLLKLKDGTLLMTYSFRKPPFGIRGKISRDHGATWSEEFRLTEDGATWDLGYPSTAQLADGSLVTVWYEVVPPSFNAALRQARWKLK
jgi:sialidase-1